MYEAATSEEKTGRTLGTQLPAPTLLSFEPVAFDLDLSNFFALPSSSSLLAYFCLYAARVFTYSNFFCVALLMSSMLALCVVHPDKA
jgi:hypothetical protein